MMNVIPLYSSPLSRPLVRRAAAVIAVVALCAAATVALAGRQAADPHAVDGPAQEPARSSATLVSPDRLPGDAPLAPNKK